MEDAPWHASKDELIDYAIRSWARLWKLLKISRILKTMRRFLRVLKIFGRIIPVKMTFSSTKMSIDFVPAEMLEFKKLKQAAVFTTQPFFCFNRIVFIIFFVKMVYIFKKSLYSFPVCCICKIRLEWKEF